MGETRAARGEGQADAMQDDRTQSGMATPPAPRRGRDVGGLLCLVASLALLFASRPILADGATDEPEQEGCPALRGLPPGHPPLSRLLPPGHPPLGSRRQPPGHPPLEGRALPPGHPPVDARPSLPPGHPPIDGRPAPSQRARVIWL
jgi:hypothetical protein